MQALEKGLKGTVHFLFIGLQAHPPETTLLFISNGSFQTPSVHM